MYINIGLWNSVLYKKCNFAYNLTLYNCDLLYIQYMYGVKVRLFLLSQWGRPRDNNLRKTLNLTSPENFGNSTVDKGQNASPNPC
jgi:hypothetical protein